MMLGAKLRIPAQTENQVKIPKGIFFSKHILKVGL